MALKNKNLKERKDCKNINPNSNMIEINIPKPSAIKSRKITIISNNNNRVVMDFNKTLLIHHLHLNLTLTIIIMDTQIQHILKGDIKSLLINILIITITLIVIITIMMVLIVYI